MLYKCICSSNKFFQREKYIVQIIPSIMNSLMYLRKADYIQIYSACFFFYKNVYINLTYIDMLSLIKIFLIWKEYIKLMMSLQQISGFEFLTSIIITLFRNPLKEVPNVLFYFNRNTSHSTFQYFDSDENFKVRYYVFKGIRHRKRYVNYLYKLVPVLNGKAHKDMRLSDTDYCRFT